MTEIPMIGAMQMMLYYVVIGVCIITIPILIVGLIMSIVQAATQINEMTVTFIPKFVAMFILLFMMSPWLMVKLIELLRGFMTHLPMYVR